MKIISCTNGILGADVLEQAAGCILRSGVIAYPTDTVYGIGGNIFNEKAVKRIFAIKERPYNKPAPVMIADNEMIYSLIRDVPDETETLITKFWPGALTIIFNAVHNIPEAVRGKENKIGLRIPDHEGCRELVRKCGVPLISTSLNISGQKPVLSIDDMDSLLMEKFDIIIDGGRCSGEYASTVLDLTTNPPSILRKGRVPVEEVEIILGENCTLTTNE